jgi:hypothetical protein
MHQILKRDHNIDQEPGHSGPRNSERLGWPCALTRNPQHARAGLPRMPSGMRSSLRLALRPDRLPFFGVSPTLRTRGHSRETSATAHALRRVRGSAADRSGRLCGRDTNEIVLVRVERRPPLGGRLEDEPAFRPARDAKQRAQQLRSDMIGQSAQLVLRHEMRKVGRFPPGAKPLAVGAALAFVQSVDARLRSALGYRQARRNGHPAPHFGGPPRPA